MNAWPSTRQQDNLGLNILWVFTRLDDGNDCSGGAGCKGQNSTVKRTWRLRRSEREASRDVAILTDFSTYLPIFQEEGYL